MHESIADRPLRWVTSAFGFYCAIQGPLAGAQVVDRDAHAMLDLRQIDPDAIDGLVVVNTFGGVADISAYEDFARRHGGDFSSSSMISSSRSDRCTSENAGRAAYLRAITTPDSAESGLSARPVGPL